jgi:hypothetical protein
MKLRTGLRRRIANLARRLYELDTARINVVMAFIGYLWFWTDDDHARAQGMLDDTRTNLSELILAASDTPPSPERLRVLSLRVLAGYVIGLRDIRYRRATVDEAVRSFVNYVFE